MFIVIGSVVVAVLLAALLSIFLADRRKLYCSHCRDYTCKVEWKDSDRHARLVHGQLRLAATRTLIKMCRRCGRQRSLKEKHHVYSRAELDEMDEDYDREFARHA